MCDRCVCFAQAINLILGKVNAMSQPGVFSEPTTGLQIVERAHVVFLQAVIIFISGLAQMSMQAHAFFHCENGRFFHQGVTY